MRQMRETWKRKLDRQTESKLDQEREKKERERGSNQIFRVAAGSRGRTLSLVILSDNGLTHTHPFQSFWLAVSALIHQAGFFLVCVSVMLGQRSALIVVAGQDELPSRANHRNSLSIGYPGRL